MFGMDELTKQLNKKSFFLYSALGSHMLSGLKLGGPLKTAAVAEKKGCISNQPSTGSSRRQTHFLF